MSVKALNLLSLVAVIVWLAASVWVVPSHFGLYGKHQQAPVSHMKVPTLDRDMTAPGGMRQVACPGAPAGSMSCWLPGR